MLDENLDTGLKIMYADLEGMAPHLLSHLTNDLAFSLHDLSGKNKSDFNQKLSGENGYQYCMIGNSNSISLLEIWINYKKRLFSKVIGRVCTYKKEHQLISEKYGNLIGTISTPDCYVMYYVKKLNEEFYDISVVESTLEVNSIWIDQSCNESLEIVPNVVRNYVVSLSDLEELDFKERAGKEKIKRKNNAFSLF